MEDTERADLLPWWWCQGEWHWDWPVKGLKGCGGCESPHGVDLGGIAERAAVGHLGSFSERTRLVPRA